jgi:DNA mismatch repair protein MutL
MKAETFSLPFTGRKEPPAPANVPVEQEFPVASDGDSGARAWKWFEFLAVTNSGYVLIETDSGLVTINPHAARERIAFEKLIDEKSVSQQLLIPETVRLSPVDFGRIRQSLETIAEMGFSLEEFGANTFKIDAVPQIIGGLSPAAILSTIAKDLSEGGTERGGKWKAERIAKSIARSFSGSEIKLTAETAVKLVEELCACRMPYICPRGRCIMIFTSTRELNKKFDR